MTPTTAVHKFVSLKLYLIAFGIGLAVLHNFVVPISATIQWIVFAGTMLLTGIPHGAIDHLVDEKNRLHHHKGFAMVQFLTQYLSKMALYAVLWWFFPILAFVVFIGISAYHFGETDLIDLPKHEKAEPILFLSYGWVLLSILLFTHQSEIMVILNSLPNFLDSVATALVALFGKYRFYYFGFCSCWLFAALYFYKVSSKASITPILIMLLQGIVILTICSQLPFLLAFAFYFGLWHSLLCLSNIRQYLMVNSELLQWNQLVKKAVIFSVIAILGIVAFMFVGSRYSQTSDLLLWLFIGIAVLTAPHMEIMSTMFSEIRSNDKTVQKSNALPVANY